MASNGSMPRVWIATGVLALAAVCAPVAANAQGTTGGVQGADINAKRVTLNLENADIRYGLKLLFSSAGANYSLDQAVQGTVTVSLTDVPFRTALESILRSTQSTTPLTYRVEDNVYIVSPRQVVEGGSVGGTTDQPAPAPPKERLVKIPLNFIDVQTVAQAFGLGMIQSRFSGLGGGNMGNGGYGNGAFGGFNGGFGGFNGGFNGGFGNFGNGFGNGANGGFGLNSGFGNFGIGFGNGPGFGNGSGLGNGAGFNPGNGSGFRR